MYENAFKSLLASKKLAPAYLIFGACDLSLELLAKRAEIAYAPERILRFSDSDYDARAAVEFLSTNDLFAAKKLLKIESFKENLSTAEIKRLFPLASADAAVLFIAHTPRAQPAAQRAAGENFVRVFKKSPGAEQLGLLEDFARLLSVRYARKDLAALAEFYAADIARATEQLRKFAGGELDLALCDFENAFSEDFAVLFEWIFSAQMDAANVQEILANAEPIAVLNKLASEFERLFKLHAHAQAHGAVDFKVALGFLPPPNVRKQMQLQSLRCADFYEQIFALIIFSLEEIILNGASGVENLCSCVLKIKRLLT